ncbi:hypothetical protein ACH5RR_015673 [Cinchona calisaya]|uniref:Uncharacterized protein n=1 Tax=Cinchona calisaya TaxID=153742 RepID=A0ABD2ZTU9_9GENT
MEYLPIVVVVVVVVRLGGAVLEHSTTHGPFEAGGWCFCPTFSSNPTWRAYIASGGSGGGGKRGAVGGAVRLNDPTGFLSEVAKDLVDVCTGGEGIAAVLTKAVEDLGSDGPHLSLPHFLVLSFSTALLL